MPGKDFLALMLKAGFHRVALRRYTGFKSSPYTEGALFYGEKPAAGQTRDDVVFQAAPPGVPLKRLPANPAAPESRNNAARVGRVWWALTARD